MKPYDYVPLETFKVSSYQGVPSFFNGHKKPTLSKLEFLCQVFDAHISALLAAALSEEDLARFLEKARAVPVEMLISLLFNNSVTMGKTSKVLNQCNFEAFLHGNVCSEKSCRNCDKAEEVKMPYGHRRGEKYTTGKKFGYVDEYGIHHEARNGYLYRSGRFRSYVQPIVETCNHAVCTHMQFTNITTTKSPLTTPECVVLGGNTSQTIDLLNLEHSI